MGGNLLLTSIQNVDASQKIALGEAEFLLIRVGAVVIFPFLTPSGLSPSPYLIPHKNSALP